MSKEVLHRLSKLAQHFAPGIPDKNVYGDVLNTLQPGDETDFVLQHHKTVRNPKVPHYDMRLGTKDTNLFSWAIPKAQDIDRPTRISPVIQTQLHTHQYGNFEGDIPHGYGAGTVTIKDKGTARIDKVTPRTLHFTLTHKDPPTQHVLIHIGGRKGDMWQLITRYPDKKVETRKVQAQNAEEALQKTAGGVVREKTASGMESVVVTFRGHSGKVKGRARLDVANTPETKRIGLMFRESLPDGRGMLFDSVGVYWMKNVSFPLDLLFVDAKGVITEKVKMDVHKEGEPYTYYSPTKGNPVISIELPFGWCHKKGIQAGDKVDLTTRDE